MPSAWRWRPSSLSWCSHNAPPPFPSPRTEPVEVSPICAEAKMWKTSWLPGMVVSMALVNDHNPTPRFANSVTVSIRWGSDFQTGRGLMRCHHEIADGALNQYAPG